MGEGVTLVSSAEETAKEVYRVLMAHDLLRSDEAAAPQHVFRSTGPSDTFARLSQRFLGPGLGGPGLSGAGLSGLAEMTGGVR
jgi:glutamate racemase